LASGQCFRGTRDAETGFNKQLAGRKVFSGDVASTLLEAS
jgi:hypothetical protein